MLNDAAVPGSCGIAIMAKASKAGVTKTRLSPCVGMETAARLNTAFLKDAAANVIAASRDAQIRGFMAFGPPEERDFFDFLPSDFGLIDAWHRDFGITLTQAFAGILQRGHVSACLVNADSPTLPPSFLAQAATALREPGERLVVGPSTDGGYYLIGARILHRSLFENIAWSTATVFEETLDKAAKIGIDVMVLPTWYDVDDAASFEMLRSELFGDIPFGLSNLPRGAARHTRALMSDLGFDAPVGALCLSTP